MNSKRRFADPLMSSFAALLVNNRPLLDVVRTFASICLLGAMYALQEAMTEVACGLLSIRYKVRPHAPQHPPFSRRYQQRERRCIRDRLRHKVGSQGIGCKRESTRPRALLFTVPYNVIKTQLRSIHRPNDARITVTEDQTTYRLKEEHLGGWMGVEDQSVRRSAPAMRLPEA
jgi:hypothetical protein